VADAIELRGLVVLARIGAGAAERAQPQPLAIDIDLDIDLTAGAASDDLADTLDYGPVCDAVARVAGAREFALLERFASVVADELLADDRVRAVTVAVCKLRPPVPHKLATAGVRLTRARPS
jgi:dihydroneopterin aldolase